MKINIFWFRKDLRLHDNHGLYQALSEDLKVVPIFIFDQQILTQLSDSLLSPEDNVRLILSNNNLEFSIK